MPSACQGCRCCLCLLAFNSIRRTAVFDLLPRPGGLVETRALQNSLVVPWGLGHLYTEVGLTLLLFPFMFEREGERPFMQWSISIEDTKFPTKYR